MPTLLSVYKRANSPVYWGSVMVNGKSKQYALCENKAAAQRMLAYIKAEQKGRSKYGATPILSFIDRYMEWALANKAKQMVARDKIVKKCGHEGNVHKLRYTFASHLVQNGVDLYMVSKLLGHSSIKTTEIYAHLSPVTLSSTIEKLPKV